MKDFVKIGILYDFYGELLTQKQKDAISFYYDENMSLSEIADEFHISRQAVHDTLKNAESVLQNYEDVLALIKKAEMREKLAKKAYGLIDKFEEFESDDERKKALREVRNAIEKMNG